MSDERAKGSYLYPNTSDDPDRIDVLRNKFGIQSNSELRTEEYRATAFRMAEIAEGDGPRGTRATRPRSLTARESSRSAGSPKAEPHSCMALGSSSDWTRR